MMALDGDLTDYDSLREIREFQMSLVAHVLSPRATVLDIGSGSGHQARELSRLGFEVEAIDVAGSRYEANRVWPVRTYNGTHIPFAADSFDAVFSSHVLEHIPHIHTFQDEIHRVLKPNGLAIHILPTSSWRIASLLFNYPFRLKSVVRAVFHAIGVRKRLSTVIEEASPDGTYGARLKRMIVADRHGARGNTVGEIFLFSRSRWKTLFRQTGWLIQENRFDGVFCTGYYLLGSKLGLSYRRLLSRILGSSSHIFVLKASREGSPGADAGPAG
jgi:ubiquinone/menaquinone biosynthesis C-methylase UbiE